MDLGTVQEFDADEGYGSIHPEDGHSDLPFFVESDTAKNVLVLRRGDHVEFDVIHGAKGPEAVDVHPI